nr:hypothetical protein GCM10020092_078590 [Actinoplanes digitatis]
MPSPRRRLLALAAAAVLTVAAAPAPAVASAGEPSYRPVIFVHGSAGSAAQFETQAKRLTGNGYPIEVIEAHEYDSANIATILTQVHAGLDARITRLLAATGADRVDLVGHSLGTFVAQGYLTSSPARAARVAHYVNLDGRTAAALPGGVPTLAIWGEGDPARSIARRHQRVSPRPVAHADGVVGRVLPGDLPIPSRPRPGHDENRAGARRAGTRLGPRRDLPGQHRRRRRDARGLPGEPDHRQAPVPAAPARRPAERRRIVRPAARVPQRPVRIRAPAYRHGDAPLLPTTLRTVRLLRATAG